MSKLGIIGIITLIWLQATVSIAQTVPRTPDGGGVEGRIALFLGKHIAHPKTFHPDAIIGYNVYRASEKGEFEKQNKKPISAPSNANLVDAIGVGGVRFLQKQKKFEKIEQVFEMLQTSADTNMAIALAMTDKPLAKELGVIWYDENVKEGETYRYRLTYSFREGEESEPSPEIELTCCQPESELSPVWFPKVESKIINYRDSTAVRDTSWVSYGTSITFYGDSTGKFHHVYRAIDLEAGFQRVTQLPIMAPSDPSISSYTLDTGLVPLQFYYYCVSTEDRWGNKVFSDTTAVRVLPEQPATPQLVRATAESDGIRIAWQKVESPYLKGYFLLRRESFGFVYDSLGNIIPGEKEDLGNDSLYRTREALIPVADTTYLDNRVEFGHTYVYKLLTIDQARQLSIPSAYTKAKYVNTTPPNPPIGLRGAVVPKDRVMLTWQPNSEPDVLQYKVYRAIGQNQPAALEGLFERDSLGVLLVTDSSDLVKGTTYQYAVQAMNTSGYESELSAPISLTIKDMSPPEAPASLYGTRDWALGHRIEWEEPTDPRTFALSLYRVFDSLNSTTPDSALVYEKLHEEGVSIGAYAFRDIASVGKRGIVCRYKMKAMTVDSIYSEFSPAFNIVVPEPLLRAATRLEVYREQDAIKVQWIPTYEKHLKGYVIYRRGYNSPEKALNEKPLSPKESTSLIDDDVKEGETYYYRIVPISQNGVKGKSSKEIVYRVTPKK